MLAHVLTKAPPPTHGVGTALPMFSTPVGNPDDSNHNVDSGPNDDGVVESDGDNNDGALEIIMTMMMILVIL